MFSNSECLAHFISEIKCLWLLLIITRIWLKNSEVVIMKFINDTFFTMRSLLTALTYRTTLQYWQIFFSLVIFTVICWCKIQGIRKMISVLHSAPCNNCYLCNTGLFLFWRQAFTRKKRCKKGNFTEIIFFSQSIIAAIFITVIKKEIFMYSNNIYWMIAN